MIDAAIGLLRDRPDGGLVVEDLAERLGVTRPVVYRYFGDRAGLAAAVGERYAAMVADRIRQELTSGETDARSLLTATIEAYLEMIEEAPGLLRFVSTEAATLAGHSKVYFKDLGSSIATTIGDQLSALGLDTGAAEPWAYALIGMMYVAGDWWLEQRSMSRARFVEYLVQLTWDGMATMAASAAT